MTTKSLASAEGASTKVWWPSRVWYGRPCVASTSSTTSPHWRTHRRCLRGSLPGPLCPQRPSPLRGGEGLYNALPRRGSRRLEGLYPPAVFWRFAAAGPPSAAGLPSAIAPAVLPTPFSGWGRTLELSWGPFRFELDLACLAALLGKTMMSQDVHFRGSWKREQELVLFYTAPTWNFEILPTQKIIFQF